MNRCRASWVAALWAASNVACAPVAAPAATPVKENPAPVLTLGQDEGTVIVMPTGPMQSMIQLALDDAVRRSGRDASTLKVALAEPVTWPDGSIGCPQPGRQYTQALVPGFRIRIEAGAQVLEYHAGRRGPPFYCPADRVTEPAAADPRI